MTPPGSAGSAERYGGFRLGELHLALPMQALREVVPGGPLTRLPCEHPGVAGGIAVRGVVIPVLDLRIVLGETARRRGVECVIVMVHDEHVLGLMADGVTGVFSAEAGRADQVRASQTAASLYSGCIPGEDATMVCVLDPAALAGLPGVPMVRDPEPQRQRAVLESPRDGAAVPPVEDAGGVPTMLMRCGRMALAIDAVAVQSTLSQPRIHASALARGPCRGTVEHAGAHIPAVDLLSLCGLGRLDAAHVPDAFVIEVGSGRLALLVDTVVDIVRARPDQRVALAAHALPRPALFSGVLPAQVLAATQREPTDAHRPAYLVLDAAALRGCDEVVALAGIGQAAPQHRGEPGADGTRPGRGPRTTLPRSMITYWLGVETASPLEQVSEILPYSAELEIFADHGAMRGLVVHRGRSIPLLCLSQLTTGRAAATGPATRVLVVDCDGELLGFLVPALKAIEPASWEPELRGPGALSGRTLAMLGTGSLERLVPVLDLRGVARSVQGVARHAATAERVAA